MDGSGTLVFSEFKQLLKNMQIDVPDSKQKQIFAEVDKDGSGMIDEKEFAAAFKKLQLEAALYSYASQRFARLLARAGLAGLRSS